jgi:hypothetical protein
MSSGSEGSSKYSFISFIISIFGFFFFSVYYIGGFLGGIAILLSFLSEDVFKEKSIFQYLAILIAVIDVLGAILGWNIIVKTTA